jgi:nicotinamide-nucleotide adenylyltransferase/phosphinothricin biosynthesis protein PhpF
VLGRFQPLHLGHLEYLEAARAVSDRLVIGITKPDLQDVVPCPQDPGRALVENNPFTYFERHELIRRAAAGSGWDLSEHCIVPAPIDVPQRLIQYLPPPQSGHVLVTVYDAWGDEKSKRLEQLGYQVTVLYRRTMADRLTTGTEIRRLLRAGNPSWRRFTHEATHEYLGSFLGDDGRLNR